MLIIRIICILMFSFSIAQASILNELNVKFKGPKIKIGNKSGVFVIPVLEIKPNPNPNTYSRFETIEINPKLKQYAFSKKALSTIGFTFPRITSQFVRQFNSQAEAFNIIKTPPYGFNHLPFSWRQARYALKAKDHYNITVPVAVELNLDLAHKLGILAVGVRAEIFLYSDFQIDVFKLTATDVLVRASSLMEKGNNFKLYIRPYNLKEHFEVKLKAKLAKLIVPKELVSLNIRSISSGRHLAAEYIYNLEDPRAQAAYEQLVNPNKWHRKDLKVLNPFLKNQNAKTLSLLQQKVTLSDKLSKENKSGSVRLISKSSLDFNKKSSGLKINLFLVEYKSSKTFSEQNFSFFTKHGTKPSDHKIASYSRLEKSRYLLSSRESQVRREANILFGITDNNVIKSLDELTFSYKREDKKLSHEELEDIKGNVRRILPKAFHNKFTSSLDRVSINKANNLTFECSLFYEALELLQTLSTKEISTVSHKFLNRLIGDFYDNISYLKYGPIPSIKNLFPERNEADMLTKRELTKELSKPLDKITYALKFIFSKSNSANEYEKKWRDFASLSKNDLFVDIGSGIISRLVNAAYNKNINRMKKEKRKLTDFIAFNLLVFRKDQELPLRVIEDTTKQTGSYAEVLKRRDHALRRGFYYEYLNDQVIQFKLNHVH